MIKDLSQDEAGCKKSREGFGVVFVVYEGSGADARPVDVPTRCPCHGKGDECRIQEKDRRERKAGPSVYLTRFYCAVHKGSFTGYPRRWLPYQRAPLQWSQEEFEKVIAAMMESSEVIVEVSNEQAESDRSPLRWLETSFDAVAKTQLLPWSDLKRLRPTSHPRTRARQIERAARLTGVAAKGTATLNTMQLALDVDIGVLVDSRQAYAKAVRWRARAEAVMSVLSVLEDDGWRRLVHGARLAGLCGPAWEVQAGSGRLMALF